MTLPVFEPADIEKAATSRLVLDTVRAALIAHAEGRTRVPPPLHMGFPEADGDCHVKAGFAVLVVLQCLPAVPARLRDAAVHLQEQEQRHESKVMAKEKGQGEHGGNDQGGHDTNGNRD